MNTQRLNDLEILKRVNSGTYLSAKNQFIYDGTFDSRVLKKMCEDSQNYKRLVRIEVGKSMSHNNYTESYLTSLFRQVLNWCIYISIYGNKINFMVNSEIPECSLKTLIGMVSFWIKFTPDGSNFYEHVENTGKLGTFVIKKEESSSSGVRRIKAILK